MTRRNASDENPFDEAAAQVITAVCEQMSCDMEQLRAQIQREAAVAKEHRMAIAKDMAKDMVATVRRITRAGVLMLSTLMMAIVALAVYRLH